MLSISHCDNVQGIIVLHDGISGEAVRAEVLTHYSTCPSERQPLWSGLDKGQEAIIQILKWKFMIKSLKKKKGHTFEQY